MAHDLAHDHGSTDPLHDTHGAHGTHQSHASVGFYWMIGAILAVITGIECWW